MSQRFMKPVNTLLLLSLLVAPVVGKSEESTEVKGFGHGVMGLDRFGWFPFQMWAKNARPGRARLGYRDKVR